MEDNNDDAHLLKMVYATGVASIALGTAFFYALNKRKKNGQSVKVKKDDTDMVEIDKEIYPGGLIKVYYGSQTGTAEMFANELKREGETNGFKIDVVDLEDIVDDIEGNILNDHTRDSDGKNRVVFVMATYGEGEPTDNAAEFVNFLKCETVNIRGHSEYSEEEKKTEGFEYQSENDSPFRGLEYAVFGLGDRQYENFCMIGKVVDDTLQKKGATRLAPLGIGDDQKDIEADFENWKDNVFWPTLKKKYIGEEGEDTLKAGKSKRNDKLPVCDYVVEYLDNAKHSDDFSTENIHMSSKHYFAAKNCPVTTKRELRSANDGGSTLHIEVDIANAGNEMKYETADNLGILPMNSEAVVEAVANALKYDLNACFKLLPAPGKESKYSALFPNPCTVKECLTRYCDLSGSPRRSELKQFAAYAKDRLCKEALLRMSSKQGKAEYKEKIVEQKSGIVDIVTRFCPSIEIPLEHFVAICPRLQPRYYTISSSSSLHPESIHITASMIEHERVDGTTFRGVCTNHLATIVKNGSIRAFTRTSTFRLPADSTKPIIMIGPGTGIAPMRAFLQERAHQKKQMNHTVGKNILYFGCKKRSVDFLYADELKEFQKSDVLNNMHLAFSREQKKKVYVQHLLEKNARETWDLIENEGAYIYVCGGIKMGNDVTETLRSIISKQGGLNPDDAKLYLDQMSLTRRFIQELWA